MAPVCPRVIFLIDNYCKCIEKMDTLLTEIHLTTLRILSYYAHNSINQDTKNGVLWGFKFFNSMEEEAKFDCKRYPFLDFTTKHFVTFEKELYGAMTPHETSDRPETIQREQIVGNLRITLTNLLSDFHWERPELFSPSKKRGSSDIEEDVNNFVYLFTPAPRDENQIQRYFDLSTSQSNEKQLINRLLPKSLYVKFVKQLKIKLYWIDTTRSQTTWDRENSILQKGLHSVNGALLSIQNFTCWWLQQKNTSKKTKFVDAMNTSSLLRGLTATKKKTGYTPCKHQFKINSDSTIFSSILLCPIQHLVNNKMVCQKENESIQFEGMIAKETLSPCQLDISSAFFYTQSCSDTNEEFMCLVKNALQYNQVLKIKWKPCNQSHEFVESVMVPTTPKFGTILLLNKNENTISTSTSPNACKETEEELDEDPLVAVLKSKLSNWDFCTAIVNCVDSWFLYNPNLGFKMAAKNILRKLYKEQLLKVQNYEEKSKGLLKSLKKSLKEKEEAEEKRKREEEQSGGAGTNSESSLKIKKPRQKRTKGMTWARWRLQEYHRKQKEKLPPEAQTKSSASKQGEEEEAIVLPKQLEVEEFRSQEEMKIYLKEEWESLEEKEKFNHRFIERFVMTPIQHYSSIDEARCQELAINLLKEIYIKQMKEVRSNYEKSDLVRQYLLQIHLLLECATALQGNSEEDLDTYCDQVVAYLRTLIFEESITYVQSYLKKQIFPYFLERNNSLLIDIYEELMFDLPKQLEDYQREHNKKNKEDGDEEDDDDRSSCLDFSSPIKSIILPSSLGTSEPSSVSSQQSDRRLRRISSAIGENSHQKMIAVTVTTKRQSKSSSRKLSRRSCSSVKLNNDRTSCSEPAPPKTPTLKRRHSEIMLRQPIPETPEGKQRNDLIWKKQELNRRVSKVDKRMGPIEESPLKELTSPVKIPKALYRSNSFSCRSSPRKFYAVQRVPSSQQEIVEENGDGGEGEEEEEDPESKARTITRSSSMRNILLSNFSSPPSKLVKQDSGIDDGERSNNAGEGASSRQVKTRRNIFSNRHCSETSGTDTLSSVSAESLSAASQIFSSPRRRESACKRLRLSISEDYDRQQQARPNVKIPSENTLDWLSEIEQQQNNEDEEVADTGGNFDLSFREAFENFAETNELSPPKPFVKKPPFDINVNQGLRQSPTIVKAGKESITVSPLLSVSSVEMLENAPILSPLAHKRSKKRRALNEEYTNS